MSSLRETFHLVKCLACTCLLKVRDMAVVKEKENFGNLKTEPEPQRNEQCWSASVTEKREFHLKLSC